MQFLTGERAWVSSPANSVEVSTRDMQEQGGTAPEPTSASVSRPAGAGDAAATVPGVGAASPGFTALLAQARLAQAQLAAQPLPIANHSGDFILKLFGG